LQVITGEMRPDLKVWEQLSLYAIFPPIIELIY
jgi:hypothetical protein